MKTKIVEATNGLNWGKFLVGEFASAEWARRSVVDRAVAMSLLWVCGHRPEARLVLDLETREGAIFYPHGLAKADLRKHAVHVCPLFDPFLTWLYQHPDHCRDIETLPDLVLVPLDGGEPHARIVRTIHILHEGHPLCQFSSELPSGWPAGHKWTGVIEHEKATCPSCVSTFTALTGQAESP